MTNFQAILLGEAGLFAWWNIYCMWRISNQMKHLLISISQKLEALRRFAETEVEDANKEVNHEKENQRLDR